MAGHHLSNRMVFGAVLLMCFLTPPLAAQALPTFNPADSRASFQAMSEYLSADGGQWRGANPNHDPERDKSPPAFGLWFDWVHEEQILELRIVVHFEESTLISSSGHFVWHPGERRVAYRMVGRNGSLTEGTTDFTDSSTFRTIATFFRPDGQSDVHRDLNMLVSHSVHSNETFARDSTGAWQSGGVYEWHRETEPAPR